MAAAVDALGHARIMRGDQKRRAGALLQGRETIEQPGGRSRIEAGGRFVGQDDGRFGDEGAPDTVRKTSGAAATARQRTYRASSVSVDNSPNREST